MKMEYELTEEDYKQIAIEEAEWKEEKARIEALKLEHKSCNLQYAMAGAPGVGGTITCLDHNILIENTIRIQEPWEVR
jgi:hypothetical protein